MHLNQIFNSCYQQHLGGHLSALSNTCYCSGEGVPTCILISSFKQESLINTGLIVAGPMMTEGPPMNSRSLMAVLYSFYQPLIIFYTKWDKSKTPTNYRRTIRRLERKSKQFPVPIIENAWTSNILFLGIIRPAMYRNVRYPEYLCLDLTQSNQSGKLCQNPV